MSSLERPLIEVARLRRKFPKSLNSALRYGWRDIAKAMFSFRESSKGLYPGEFWALDGVDFEICRGESVALLGLNGSGKSTLLKSVAGILQPTSGEITVRGKVEGLLELGAGFHPLLTGRENIQLKCAQDGLSRFESEAVCEKIVEFAELGEFINLPIANYSSGMSARLGFAAAVYGRPDVLLVDEVLAVGDFRFRQKCLDKMNSMKRDAAVVFVSHSMQQVRNFCDRGVVLRGGTMLFDGPIGDAIGWYVNSGPPSDDTGEIFERLKAGGLLGEEFLNREKLSFVESYFADAKGGRKTVFSVGEPIFLHLEFRFKGQANRIHLGVPFRDSRGELLTAINSNANNVEFRTLADGTLRGVLEIENVFNPGLYFPAIAIHVGPEYVHRGYLEPIRVSGGNPRLMGAFTPRHRWCIESGETDAGKMSGAVTSVSSGVAENPRE